MNFVFLGGTCNDSTWRDRFIKLLDPDVTYFNPVVKDWTEKCIIIENREKATARYNLFCITPKMTGVYSIAEAVQCSNRSPRKTIFVLLHDDDGKTFTPGEWKSLKATSDLINSNGALVYYSLEDAAHIINIVHRSTK